MTMAKRKEDIYNKYKKPMNQAFFIIGKSRSGTKLLASILSNHPNIAISNNEINFLPYYIKKDTSIEDLSNKQKFNRLYKSLLKTDFFLNRKKENNLIDKEYWYAITENKRFDEFISTLVKYYSNELGKKNIIWGIKSPSYITKVHLLKKQFPEAKFIHIVREIY